MAKSEPIQIVTTVETKEQAGKIARALLEARLAGCVQVVGPIASSYWWEGKIAVEQEWLLQIKSLREYYLKVEETIKAHHPYSVPEILALPVIEGNLDYLKWLEEETGG